MRRWLWIGLLLLVSTAVARVTTFSWDASPIWPAGTTVELCSNGVCASGITGISHTLDVPIQPGERFDAKARAVATDGLVSDWSTLVQTWPTNPVGLWSEFRKKNNMAISFVNGTTSNNIASSTTIASSALSLTAGNTVIVGISSYTTGGVSVSSVSDTAGNTYTRAGNEEGGDANHKVSVWYATNVTGNANNIVTATFASSAAYRVICVAQFSGLAASGVYDQTSTLIIPSSGTAQTSGNTGTTTQNDELVVGFYVAWDSTQVLTASAPMYLGAYDAGYQGVIAYKVVSSTGAQSTTLTAASATRYTIQVKTFKAAGAVGATALPRRALDGPFYGALRGSVR